MSHARIEVSRRNIATLMDCLQKIATETGKYRSQKSSLKKQSNITLPP